MSRGFPEGKDISLDQNEQSDRHKMDVYDDGIHDFEVEEEKGNDVAVQVVLEGEEDLGKEVDLDIESSQSLIISFWRNYLKCTACLLGGRKLCNLASFLVLCSLFGIYLYDMGLLRGRLLGQYRTLVNEELKETLNAVKNACWSFRFVLLYAVGWIYFSNPHLKKTLCELALTREYWKKAQKWLFKFLTVFVVFVFIMPLTCRGIQMSLPTKYQGDAFPTGTMVANLIVSFWSRFLALPIFVTFVFVVYLTFTKIREFKRRLQRWPKARKHEARDQFNDIMILVKNNEKAFQKFLLVQVGLMLVVLIPAILSFAERINAEVHYKVEYMKADDMSSARSLSEKGSPVDVQTKGNISEPLLSRSAPNGTARYQWLGPSPTPYTEDHIDKNMMFKVAANALGLCFEMLVLCSLPLFLLAKVSKVMSQLPETVRMLKFGEQQEGGYMVQSEDNLAEVLKFLEGARGFRVLGMDLTTVKVALVTLVTPFITTAIHLMMEHVDIAN